MFEDPHLSTCANSPTVQWKSDTVHRNRRRPYASSPNLGVCNASRSCPPLPVETLMNHRFANMAEFVKLMSELSKDGVPYTLGKEG